MTIHQHPAAPPHAPAVMAILNRFNRDELGNAIEVLVALLDIWDGDPDKEGGDDAEDDFLLSADAVKHAAIYPDLDCIDQDAGAYVEWLTVHGNLKRKGQSCILAGHEDDEDDDPAEEDDGPEEDDPSGQCDEDGINCGPGNSASLNWFRQGPGCEISDAGGRGEEAL